MHRWKDFGTLGKAATITGWGGAIGVVLAVVAGKISGSPDAVWIVLVAWFAPVFIWGFCALSVAARSNWPVTAATLTLFFVLGAMFNPANAAALPVILIGVPILCAVMALFASPARALLDFGKSP